MRQVRVLVIPVLAAILLSVCSTSGFAQSSPLSRYTYDNTLSLSFVDATGGTFVTSGDDSYNSISLPFTFNYDSTDYSVIYPGTNGYATFRSGYSTYGSFVGSTTIQEGVLPISADMYVNSGIYCTTTGSAPNRVFIIEWYNIRQYGGSTTTNVEVKLYESTNVIEYVYQQHGYSLGSASMQSGINGYAGAPWGFQYKATTTGSSSTPTADIRISPALNNIPARVTASPRTLDYSFVNTGNSATKCFTISAISGPGLGPIAIKTVSLSTNGDYTILPGGISVGDTIQPGTSRQTCVQFSPIAAGTRAGSVTIVTNGLDSGTVTINLTGIGVAPGISITDPDLFRKSRVRIGDSLMQCFTVNSSGTGPLTITSVQVQGANPDQYAVRSMPTGVIPAGETGTICVVYLPSYEGRPDAQIVVNSNALNSPTLRFQTYGVGVIPHFSFMLPDSSLATAATLRFDSVTLGQTVCKTQRIVNYGSDTLAIMRNYLSSNDADFVLTAITRGDTLIPPGQSRDVTICFTPLKEGLRVATVRFATNLPLTFPRPGRDTSQFVLSIQGTGVPFGQLSVAGTAIDSGIIGVSNCVMDTLRNTGSAELTVASWSVTGTDASEFTVSGATPPFTLKPGDMRVVTVCLTATQRGPRTAAIAVTGSSAGTPVNVTLPLLGYGLQVCASATPQTPFTSTPVLIGQSTTATVTVTNCGDVATVYDATVQQTGSDYSVAPAQSVMVPASGTATFTVTYAAHSMNTSNGTLHITGGTQVTPMDITLNAVGGGVTATSTAADAGDVAVGDCKDVTLQISNNGNVDWTPGTVSLSSGMYTFVSLNPAVIPAGQSGTLTLKFCPTAVGTTTTNVTFPGASPSPIGGFSATATGRGITSGVAETTEAEGFVLAQNYPNPTAAKSEIRFTAPGSAHVRIELLNLKGELVKVIEDSRVGQGEHSVSLDTHSLASGTYYYVLSSGSVRLARQLTVTK
jgi:hypothetical protein